MLDLEKLSGENLRNFFQSFDHVLCDMDGVIFYVNTPIEGAAKSVQKLRDIGKKVRFVTNNCLQTADMLYNKLEKAEFGSEKDAYIFPTMVLLEHLKNDNFDKEVFVIGGKFLKQELVKHGYKVAPDGPDRIEESVPALLGAIKDNPEVGAVVVDIDVNVNYIKVLSSIIYLKRPEVKLYFLGTDELIPLSPKLSIVGPHYFQKMIKGAIQQEPIECAKPSTSLAQFVKTKFQIDDPQRVLFVGDALLQDISFSHKSGFQSLLVLTGATKEEDLRNWNKPDDHKPDYYVDGIASLKALIESVNL